MLRKLELPTVPEVATSRQINMDYLPPYAPKANPGELCFNVLRTHIGRERPRNSNALRECIATALQALTPQVCAATMRKVWQVGH